jgi:hypothetical protein
MHRLAYLNRGLMAAMIADLTGSFRYQPKQNDYERPAVFSFRLAAVPNDLSVILGGACC